MLNVKACWLRDVDLKTIENVTIYGPDHLENFLERKNLPVRAAITSGMLIADVTESDFLSGWKPDDISSFLT